MTTALENFQKTLESKYEGLTLTLSDRSTHDGDLAVRIMAIHFPKELRKQGLGTLVMQEITDWADSNGSVLVLTASTDFGATSVSRLKKFYKRFGFKENKGRNKDFRFFDSMIRLPSRKNPSAFVQDSKYKKIIANYKSRVNTDKTLKEEVYNELETHYRMSTLAPQKFLESFSHENFDFFISDDFIFVGKKGRCLQVIDEDRVVPYYKNDWDFDQLNAIALSPDVLDFKLPLLCGNALIKCPSREELQEEYEESANSMWSSYDEYFDFPRTYDPKKFKEHRRERANIEQPYEFLVNEILYYMNDGNHRTFGAILAGDVHPIVQLVDYQYDIYTEWVEKGRPENVENRMSDGNDILILKFIDNNLLEFSDDIDSKSILK